MLVVRRAASSYRRPRPACRRPARAGGRGPRGAGAAPRCVGRPPARRGGPAVRGPSTIASATARLSVTTGLGASACEQVVEPKICGQSVSRQRSEPRRGRRRSQPAAGTGRRRAAVATAGSARRPRRSARVPAAAILLGQRNRAARRVRRARALRAWVSSISASSPATSSSPGSSACSHPRQPDRLARELDARCSSRAGARGVALVEDQVEHVQHGAPAARRAPASAGGANAPPASLIVASRG